MTGGVTGTLMGALSSSMDELSAVSLSMELGASERVDPSKDCDPPKSGEGPLLKRLSSLAGRREVEEEEDGSVFTRSNCRSDAEAKGLLPRSLASEKRVGHAFFGVLSLGSKKSPGRGSSLREGGT